MEEPHLPPDEPERLAALRMLEILDTPAEERFDRVTRMARRLFDVPIALVSLVDEKRQWFKSSQGLLVNETPRAVSFCAHAILGDGPFVVPDASEDVRFADNPLVTGPPDIRFYAGVPLRGLEGERLGTLCIIDREPRSLSASEVESLVDLASWAQSELRVVGLTQRERELVRERNRFRHQALVDPLTRVWSRGAIDDLLEREVARSRREGGDFSVAMVDLDRFKRVNDEQGHPAGDLALREVAQRIRAAVRTYDLVGRYGGEEFLLLLPGADAAEAPRVGERVRARVAADLVDVGTAKIELTASVGIAVFAPGVKPDALVAAADEALRRCKKGGRDRVEVATFPEGGFPAGGIA